MRSSIKLMIAAIILSVGMAPAFGTRAYPPFLQRAAKYGAKDCLFCHVKPQGGEGWNERGNWLLAEKERRKADAVDVDWLADYKEGDTAGDKDKRQGQRQGKD